MKNIIRKVIKIYNHITGCLLNENVNIDIVKKYMIDNNYKIVTNGFNYRIQKMVNNKFIFLYICHTSYYYPRNYVIECSNLKDLFAIMNNIMNKNNKRAKRDRQIKLVDLEEISW